MAMPTERYEILILGSAAGGKLLAWDMAGAGHRTAVVERRWISGSCPNINCLPSKNEIWSAKVADLVRHAADFGLVTGSYKTDMRRGLERKHAMVDAEVAAHLENYTASGAELIMGAGRFVAPKTVEVRLNGGGTRVLAGDRVFLNLGTHATIPSIPGLSDSRPLTNIELLELDRAPEKLPMSAVLRTHTTGETAGFMKVLVEASGDRILGFTMLGTEAGEVVAAVQTAMLGGLSHTVLRDAILAH